jgi:hypothetical protein
VKGLVIVSVLCLAAGLWLIFGYCNGTTGLQLGSPIAASSLRLNLVTNGWPAILGLTLTAIGAVMQVVTLLAALLGLVWWRDVPLKRREEPFEE